MAMYPYCVYFVKKCFKLKSFWTINLSVLPILLFFNVRIYALSQTYIGFKLIESNYNKLNQKTKENIKYKNLQSLNEDAYGKVYFDTVKYLQNQEDEQ